MTKVAFYQGRAATSVGAGSTQNFPFFNSNMIAGDNSAIIRRTCVVSGLYIRVITNSRGASTYKFRINGVDGNQSISIGASSTGEFEDTTNTDNITSGDAVNAQLVVGTGGSSFIFTSGRIFFTPGYAGGTITRVGGTDHDPISTASTTFFYTIGGRIATGNTTETGELINFKIPGIVKNLGVEVATNARSTDSTVGLRLNGADSGLVITATASTTGLFENTGTNQAVAVDDTSCIFMRLGTGTGNFRCSRGLYWDYETTTTKYQVFSGQASAAGAALSPSTTYYRAIGGPVDNGVTTEANAQIPAGLSTIFTNLQARVEANSITADSTVTLRKNSAATALTVTITGSTTGLFQDNTHSDSCIGTDQLTVEYAMGAGGTSMSLTAVSVVAELPIFDKGIFPRQAVNRASTY